MQAKTAALGKTLLALIALAACVPYALARPFNDPRDEKLDVWDNDAAFSARAKLPCATIMTNARRSASSLPRMMPRSGRRTALPIPGSAVKIPCGSAPGSGSATAWKA